MDQEIALQIDQGGVGDEVLARDALQSVSDRLRRRGQRFFTLGFDKLDDFGPVRHLGGVMDRLLPVADGGVAFGEIAVESLLGFAAIDGEQFLVQKIFEETVKLDAVIAEMAHQG